jgi:hypothetical protein
MKDIQSRKSEKTKKIEYSEQKHTTRHIYVSL